jgi:hypothetical protein
MQAPKIQTAIPRARFRLGAYSAVVLGDIESPDPVRYHLVLALVKDGQSAPGFFVVCEKNPRSKQAQGTHRLRVLSEVFNEEMGSSNAWADPEAFAQEALAIAARVLGLSNAEPQRVM